MTNSIFSLLAAGNESADKLNYAVTTMPGERRENGPECFVCAIDLNIILKYIRRIYKSDKSHLKRLYASGATSIYLNTKYDIYYNIIFYLDIII